MSSQVEYTLRQRVALVVEASVTAETIVGMSDADISHTFLMSQRISPTLLRAAAVTPLQLKAHGTTTPEHAAALGFTAMHLLNAEWCDSAISAYGAPALLDEFLHTSNDAVILAGSAAVEQLGVNLGLLLLVCADQPGAAREVLAQYRHARQVPPETLIETGLKAPDLIALGLTAKKLRADTLATNAQLAMLGFRG